MEIIKQTTQLKGKVKLSASGPTLDSEYGLVIERWTRSWPRCSLQAVIAFTSEYVFDPVKLAAGDLYANAPW